MLCRIFIFLSLFVGFIHANSIKSTSGNIIIDVNNDGTSEVIFNSDGFAIGSGLSPSANLHVQGSGAVTGNLVVGASAGNSIFEIAGTMGYETQTISSNTTLGDNSVILVDTSSDNIAVTLPYAGNVTGIHYTIKKYRPRMKLI